MRVSPPFAVLLSWMLLCVSAGPLPAGNEVQDLAAALDKLHLSPSHLTLSDPKELAAQSSSTLKRLRDRKAEANKYEQLKSKIAQVQHTPLQNVKLAALLVNEVNHASPYFWKDAIAKTGFTGRLESILEVLQFKPKDQEVAFSTALKDYKESASSPWLYSREEVLARGRLLDSLCINMLQERLALEAALVFFKPVANLFSGTEPRWSQQHYRTFSKLDELKLHYWQVVQESEKRLDKIPPERKAGVEAKVDLIKKAFKKDPSANEVWIELGLPVPKAWIPILYSKGLLKTNQGGAGQLAESSGGRGQIAWN